jgi:hypothetical protein
MRRRDVLRDTLGQFVFAASLEVAHVYPRSQAAHLETTCQGGNVVNFHDLET